MTRLTPDKTRQNTSVLRSYLLYALLLLCICIAALFYPPVRFIREQIDIRVCPDHISVRGIYVFKNPFPFPVVQGFFYPVPTDEDHPEPVLLSAEKLLPGQKTVPLNSVFGKFRYNLFFRAKEEIAIQIEYRQDALEKNACYILTTTKLWKYPLQQGLYRLFTDGADITFSNYPLEHNGQLLYFKKKQFMPEEDWYFSWEVKK
ncbi:hypothetical protein QUF80_01900 [Desulfococcaceae bacterium HSG8]|nr:hypothetical protein [Desulfococcaceae bacterium HSG8]